ncbi:hypothetical protein H0W91_02740 [Patescibacteria group bacterium]|nr:hypothetical protein [Patescibacteria group bacterium]
MTFISEDKRQEEIIREGQLRRQKETFIEATLQNGTTPAVAERMWLNFLGTQKEAEARVQ